jgi:acetyl esterase
MPLDPQAKRILRMLDTADEARQVRVWTPARMREAMVRLAQTCDLRGPAGGVENRELPRVDATLPMRIFSPAETAVEQVTPGIVYFHGGAGVFCGIETHEGLCRLLADTSGCRVVSVGYRLAPEHPFPAAIEDAWFASCWVSEYAGALNIDRSRIAGGGDSVGGTLAAVVCQRAKQEGRPALALQLLLCPVTDATCETASWRTYAQGYFLERATLDWAMALYAPQTDRRDVRLSPLRALDLAALPPAHVHTAEFDPLRDEGKAYAERLARAGVPVRYTCHAGMIHHFYCMARAISYGEAAIRHVGAAVQQALS